MHVVPGSLAMLTACTPCFVVGGVNKPQRFSWHVSVVIRSGELLRPAPVKESRNSVTSTTFLSTARSTAMAGH